MLFAYVYRVVCVVLGLILTRGRAVSAAEIEFLVLRHERRVLRRRVGGVAWRPGDRLWLTALSRCLPRSAWHVFPVHPTTLRRWHREVVRRPWAATGKRRQTGRPLLPAAVRDLIARLARENSNWGYLRIKGELLKLGHEVSATAIRTTLRRRGVPPAPQRAGLTWPVFLRAQAAGLLASAPAIGRALGTGLLAVWLLRVVLTGRLPARHRGRMRGTAVARRVPRPPLPGTWSPAATGTPPSATRVSRVWVPVAGGQRGPADVERRTDLPWWVEAAWQRPGDRRGVVRPRRPVPAACRGRAPPTADGHWMRADTGTLAAVCGGSASWPHQRRAWPAETERLSAA